MNITELYNLYKNKFTPWDSGITDDYFDGEITILDDEVGGIVFLNSKKEDTPHLDRIIKNIKEDIIKAKNYNLDLNTCFHCFCSNRSISHIQAEKSRYNFHNHNNHMLK